MARTPLTLLTLLVVLGCAGCAQESAAGPATTLTVSSTRDATVIVGRPARGTAALGFNAEVGTPGTRAVRLRAVRSQEVLTPHRPRVVGAHTVRSPSLGSSAPDATSPALSSPALGAPPLEDPGLRGSRLSRHQRQRRRCVGCLRGDQHLVRSLQRHVMIPKDPVLVPSPELLSVASRVLSVHIHGQRVVIVEPRFPNGRAVLFEHGADETANLDIDEPPSSPTILALVRAGYAWAESDAGFNNWGNAASVADDAAVAVWLRHHGDPVIDLGGDSMGGLDATELIPRVNPEAVFELFPVTSLASVRILFGADIRLAHTTTAALSPVPVRDARGLPILITASPYDTVVAKLTNADVLYREAAAAGADVTEVTTSGEHDNPSNWTPARIIAFLDRAAATARAATARVAARTS